MHLDHRKYNFPGIILSVSRDGRAIKHYTSGVSNIENNTAMDHRLLVRCGTVTRSFTAAVLLRLADQQALDIDLPLERLSRIHQQDNGLLSLMVAQYPFLKPVTVRELLGNVSGLPAFDRTQAYHDIFLKKPLKKWQLENYLDAISGSDVDYQIGYEVGQRGHYSDSATNFVVAGLVAEAVAGVHIAELIRDLFGTLTLKNTHYLSDGMIGSDLLPTMLSGYLPVSHPYAMAFQQQRGFYYNDSKELQVYDVTASYAINGMADAAMVAASSDLIYWFQQLTSANVVTQHHEAMMQGIPIVSCGGEKTYHCLGFCKTLTKQYGEIIWAVDNSLGSSLLLAHAVNKNVTFALVVNVSREYFDLNGEGFVADVMRQLLLGR